MNPVFVSGVNLEALLIVVGLGGLFFGVDDIYKPGVIDGMVVWKAYSNN